LAGAINSSLGMLTIFVIFLFISNPILAILYIFVAYELLRRSQTSIQTHLPLTPDVVNIPVLKQNDNRQPVNKYGEEQVVLTTNQTLEEEVVRKMAPLGHSDPAMYVSTSYKPVSEPVGSASIF
jgi:hypothetical protein